MHIHLYTRLIHEAQKTHKTTIFSRFFFNKGIFMGIRDFYITEIEKFNIVFILHPYSHIAKE